MSLKNLIKKIVLGMKSLRRPSVAYCANHGLLPSVFVRTPTAQLRELLLLPESPYTTQLNQDIFALLANRFRSGFFVKSERMTALHCQTPSILRNILGGMDFLWRPIRNI